MKVATIFCGLDICRMTENQRSSAGSLCDCQSVRKKCYENEKKKETYLLVVTCSIKKKKKLSCRNLHLTHENHHFIPLV